MFTERGCFMGVGVQATGGRLQCLKKAEICHGGEAKGAKHEVVDQCEQSSGACG